MFRRAGGALPFGLAGVGPVVRHGRRRPVVPSADRSGPRARNPQCQRRGRLTSWGRSGFDENVTPRDAGRACLPAR